MCAKKTKYLSYLEETPKHHAKIGAVATESSTKAIAASLAKSVPVTYLEGETIVKVGRNGKKSVVGKVENNRRKVARGAKATLSKK